MIITIPTIAEALHNNNVRRFTVKKVRLLLRNFINGRLANIISGERSFSLDSPLLGDDSNEFLLDKTYCLMDYTRTN